MVKHYTYGVDSNGKIQPCREEYFSQIDKRQTEISDISDIFTDYISKNNIPFNTDNIQYTIQPYGNEDSIVFYVKKPVPSDSYLVKLSANLKAKPELEEKFFKENEITEEQFFTLKSLYVNETDNKREWYVLYTGRILIERNDIDGEIIQLHYCPLFPYYEFTDSFPNALYSETNSKGYRIYSPCGINQNNISEVFKIADTESNLLERAIGNFVNICNKNIFNNKDNMSNEKNRLLYMVNDNNISKKDMFEEYEKMKKIVRKKHEQNRGFFYKGKHIVYRTENDRLVIYPVYLPESNKIQFIINGRIYSSSDETLDAIVDGTAFARCEWFDEVSEYLDKGEM